MSYYFNKVLPLSFDEVVRQTVEALKQEGFGIITEIDVTATLKAKLNQEFRPYRILGPATLLWPSGGECAPAV